MRTYVILASLFLSVAISAQTKFIKHEGNPVLRVGSPGSWESKQVSHPRIIYDGSLYRMWYAGSNDTCRQIGYATSPDGINWTKHPGNPVIKIGESGAPDGMVVSPGAVIYDGTLYHMYYTARSFVNAGTICHATSPNGIFWTKDDANNPVLKPGLPGCWDDYGLSAGPVLKQGTNWKMWYTGFCADTRWHSGIATSMDGVHWIKDSLYNPLLEPGAPGKWDEYEQWITDVLSDSSYYEAFYLGNSKQCALGYAVSRDGIAWGKYDGNPILTPEQLTDDKAFLFHSCVLRNGEEYKIWYSDGMTAQICFANTKDIPKNNKTELALLTFKESNVGKNKKQSLKDRMQLKDGFLEIDGKTADIRGKLASITGGVGNLSEKDAIAKIEVVIRDVPSIYYIFNNSIARIEPKENGVDVIGGRTNDESSFFTHKEAIFVIENGSLFTVTPTTVMGFINDGDVIGFNIIAKFGQETQKIIKPDIRKGRNSDTVEVRDETFTGLKIVIHTTEKSFGVEKDDLVFLGAK